MRPVFIDPTRTTAFEMDGITFHLRTLTARELIYVEQAAEPLVRRYTDAKATAGEGADESTYDIDLSPGDLSGLHDCLRIGIVGWEGEGAPALSLVETKDNGIRRIPEEAIDLLAPWMWTRLYVEIMAANRLAEGARAE